MYRVLTFTVLLCILLTGPVWANSLWTDEAANIYRDKIASEVGDLITIVIVEKASASQRASTETSQGTALNGGPGLGIFDFVKTFSVNYDDKNGADGLTTRQGLLDARITAQIIGKQPNGNLLVRGTKTIIINGENQEIEITGIIRKENIKPDNTIDSIYMTDVEIRYTGEGVVGDKQKPGLFERLFNWFF